MLPLHHRELQDVRCDICGKKPARHPLPSRLTAQEKADNKAWSDSLKESFHTGHCPHLELPAYGCDDHAPFKVGDRVRVKEAIEAPTRYGTIAEQVPEKGGYLVRHDGAQGLDDRLYGWSVHELEHAPLWPTRFDRV